MRGAGIWLRGERPRVELAIEHLDYVCVPLHSGERGPLIVRQSLRQWLAEFKAGGGTVWGWDWLPLPHQTDHVPGMVDDALEIGAEGICSDCEPDVGWRGRPDDARRYREALARYRSGLDLAVTDYARGGVGDLTLRALLAELEDHRPIGVPQSYDPGGRYEDDYHARSVAYWRKCGAERVVLGVGAWLRSQHRHRTADEWSKHLEHVPEDVEGVCAWYASRRGLEPLLPALGRHRKPLGDRVTPVGHGPVQDAADELLAVAARLKATHPTEAQRVADCAVGLMMR